MVINTVISCHISKLQMWPLEAGNYLFYNWSTTTQIIERWPFWSFGRVFPGTPQSAATEISVVASLGVIMMVFFVLLPCTKAWHEELPTKPWTSVIAYLEDHNHDSLNQTNPSLIAQNELHCCTHSAIDHLLFIHLSITPRACIYTHKYIYICKIKLLSRIVRATDFMTA